ncbi:gamma-glutamyl-gamma-aminobutyrate hydrolase family protein [Sorangium sp. So ce726]|uniref:glutamine amidotransferase-related protein n=1 Tax=Sorangium sp. So ce726 TaxID=3133319 RepID=UPI003F5D6210
MPLLVERGYTIEVRRLDRGDAVPDQLSTDDVLVVMGGPMGIGDLERPEYPFLRQELQLLRRRVAEDAPVLGVCLGAQLLAFAAGAPVHAMTQDDGSRCYEVGWAPIRLHPSGAADPILGGLPEESPVLHWHGDMFELPARARRLASTPRCPNQAFQLGSRMFGLQFHCEVDEESIEALLRADADFVTLASGSGGVERIRQDTQRHASLSWGVGPRLLRNILDAMTRSVRGCA